MNIKKVNSAVTTTLKSLPEITLPIKIEELAKLRGVKVMPYPLGNDISGLLAIENNQGTIGYNQNESRVRRRFTIAHELGHYELHKDESSLFVDKQFKIYRSQNSSKTMHQELEKEANAFAAAILMPEDLIKKEFEKKEIDFGSEDAVKDLAKLFDVSSTAMYFRIYNLGLV